MKLIFAGTPDIAATVLKDLLSSEHEIVAVYTQPDRPAGRGRQLTPSPVKTLALEHNLPIEQPENFKSNNALATLEYYQADAMIVLAYGIILPESALSIPKHGCINIHASLLPRWRGAAPIQHAILAGDKETGVTIMQMEAGLDTGPMFEKTVCAIEANDTAAELHDRLAAMAIKPLLNTLTNISAGNAHPEMQDESLANYAHKIHKRDAQINWHKTAIEIDRMIRAYHPWPIAFTKINGENIRIWQAKLVTSDNTKTPGTILQADKHGIVIQTGHDAIAITLLQLPGKKMTPASDVLNSHADLFATGTSL